jgi:DNA-directed RNA polymerase specialized sigma24 family protein
VVLVHAYGHSFREAARVLGVAPSTIQNHCDRGLRKLRSALGVNANV